jgi:tetratricopeptide (TPR) repeat protein/predicted Ser/Thr protein kinase
MLAAGMKDAGPTREGFWSGRDEQSDVLDETMVHSGDAVAPEPRITYAPGTAVSRYVILYEVGAGGMGVVYAAFDPELNRKIALKILIPRAAGDPRKSKERRRSADQAAGRLMREAQAIARLSHPNVVTVYDVGRHGEAVFVAMEFIEGMTLSKWLEHEPRSLADIRRVFALAGKGLIAAHDAGLVHRDFKPDNVLVSSDGRVRVLDFGLARADPTHASQLSHVSHVSHVSNVSNDDDSARAAEGVPQLRDFGESDVLSSPLTLDDAVVGTPRYMAPEQHAGVGVDARSDQFSFCVALYQALWSREPFAAERLHDLVRLKQQGQVTPIPSDSKVPPWLEELVLRGLSPRPAMRWASMHELVAALEDDPQAKRRRWLGLGGGAVLLVAITAVMGHQLGGGGERPCQDGASHLAGLWDEPRREALQRAIIGTGLPYAEHTWAEVDRRVQADLDGWVETYRDTCEATRVRGEQSDELLDLRMTCLRDHLSEVRAVLDVLAEPDAAVVQRAVGMVSTLPGLGGCADAEQLRARLPPPQDEATRERVEALRQSLREAGVQKTVQRVEQARKRVQEVLAEAETLGYEPLRIEAVLALGVVLEQAGDFAPAEARLREALWAALRVGHDAVAARAAIQLVTVVGDRLARYDEGLTWAEQAAALLDRVGEEGPARASLLNNIGNVWHRKGDNEQALSHYQHALALREQLEGPNGPNLANERINLGNAQLALGRHEAALASYREAEAGLRSSLGEGHPQIARAVASVGLVYSATGRYAEALEQHRTALPVFEEWLGPEHLFVATTILNIGDALRQLGRLDEAEAQLRRAQQLFEKSLTPEHPQVAACLFGLAEIRTAQARFDEARTLHERALGLRSKRFPEDHGDVVASRLALASVQRQHGDAGGAVTAVEALAELGERAELEPLLRAAIHLELSRARWDAGQERARVRADLERARVFIREAGAGGAPTLRELEAFGEEIDAHEGAVRDVAGQGEPEPERAGSDPMRGAPKDRGERSPSSTDGPGVAPARGAELGPTAEEP